MPLLIGFIVEWSGVEPTHSYCCCCFTHRERHWCQLNRWSIQSHTRTTMVSCAVLGWTGQRPHQDIILLWNYGQELGAMPCIQIIHTRWMVLPELRAPSTGFVLYTFNGNHRHNWRRRRGNKQPSGWWLWVCVGAIRDRLMGGQRYYLVCCRHMERKRNWLLLN